MTQIDVNKMGRVAVLYGGQSAEREVSLKSGKAIYDALLSVEVDAILIDVNSKIVDQLSHHNIDRAFIALHGVGGEDGRIQALLEFLEIPYTGSDVQASALAMDKWFSKQIFKVSNVPTPDYRLLTDDTDLEGVVACLGEALMIKPAHEGSSIGMAKISQFSELLPAYENAK